MIKKKIIVDVVTYHLTPKYFTFCFFLHGVGNYLWKLQEDTNSIPRCRIFFYLQIVVSRF